MFQDIALHGKIFITVMKDLEIKNRINQLQGQMEIQNYCQMKTDDKISYQNVYVEAYEVSNVGLKCEKGWESRIENMKANREAKRKAKRDEIENLKKKNRGTFTYEAIEKYMRNHSCWKVQHDAEKFYKCFLYPKIIGDAPIVRLFETKWMEGSTTRQGYIEIVYMFTDTMKGHCDEIHQMTYNEKITCKTNMKKLTAQLLSIAND